MSSSFSIETSFNKQQMDACNMRCLTKNQFNFLTPNQIQCFSQCTKTVSRGRYYSTDSSGIQSPDSSPVMMRKGSYRGVQQQ